jgi:hypothetical protein
MKFIKLSIALLIFALVGCVSSPHEVQIGTLTNDNVYYLDMPGQPPMIVSVYIPMASYETALVDEFVEEDFIDISFGNEFPHENTINFQIIPTRMKFSTFEKRAEKMVFSEYKEVPRAHVTHIYKEETRFNKHPATYNVYSVEYDGNNNKTIIMQYLVNYKYYQANIKFYAHTEAFTDAIFSSRSAINKTYMPAYEYFKSFRLLYEIEEESEEDEEHEEHEEEEDEEDDE